MPIIRNIIRTHLETTSNYIPDDRHIAEIGLSCLECRIEIDATPSGGVYGADIKIDDWWVETDETRVAVKQRITL